MGPECERVQMSMLWRASPCSRRDEPLGGRGSEWVELAGVAGSSQALEELFQSSWRLGQVLELQQVRSKCNAIFLASDLRQPSPPIMRLQPHEAHDLTAGACD